MRKKYGIIVLITIVAGLLSRKFMFIFPKPIAPYIGDAIWASMIYFIFRTLIPKQKIVNVAFIAIIVSYSVEISQLYQADWINIIRNTTLGGLVLGHGFLYEDLIAYLIGNIVSVVIDERVSIHRKKHE
ncbi:MAG: DUF2809 domain-containing protein [Clostridium sp.]|uniref:ribosomal maturation YjgA family protein n=1 Tax=Clostridium sp. TaxID=1506 RepID=UPI003F35CBD7